MQETVLTTHKVIALPVWPSSNTPLVVVTDDVPTYKFVAPPFTTVIERLVVLLAAITVAVVSAVVCPVTKLGAPTRTVVGLPMLNVVLLTVALTALPTLNVVLLTVTL